MEIQIGSVNDGVLIILFRFEEDDPFSAMSVNDLIADVNSAHSAILEHEDHSNTLMLVKGLLKALRGNRLLTDGTSFVDKE